MSKLLTYYTKKQSVIVIVLLAMAFGTQLFYYAFGEPGMSHVYSFCFVTLFLLKIKNWFANQEKKEVVIASLALGMVFLLRPVNVFILFILPV